MKKLWIIFLVIGLTSCGGSKKEEKTTTDSTVTKEEVVQVPDAAKDAFAKAYPNVTGAKWEAEEGNFEAEFEVDKIETSVLYNATGSLLETETSMEPTKLPDAIKKYCADNMKGKEIKEASKIADAYNVITYQAEVDGEDYIFDADGVFKYKSQEKDDDEKED